MGEEDLVLLRIGGVLLVLVLLLSFPVFSFGHVPPQEPDGEVTGLPQPYAIPEEGKSANLFYHYYALPADSAHDFDVTKYIINLKVNPASLTSKLIGQTTIQAKSQISNLGGILLDFIGLTVDSCKVNGNTVLFTHGLSQLAIDLGGSYNPGSSFSVDVFYHGNPQAGFYFGTNDYGAPVYYTFTEPYNSRYWFPCYDYPNDKARCEIICTVPQGNFVVSNGHLVSSTTNPDGTKTFRWVENYPIATYLISITASNFTQLDTQVTFGAETLAVNYWVYPQDVGQALVDFRKTPKMITYFSNLWKSYPFFEDKYSMVQAELSGAMEHQTCTSWGFPMTGDARYEHIVAHELAHHWWGNWVTCNDFANIWLNEGFASYAEALWQEYEYGPTAFKNHLIAFEGAIFASRNGSVKYPIYDPPETYLFGTAVYKKGGWVLHMLRNLLGDSLFHKGLAYYGQIYSFSTATTQQFQSAMETYSGQDLDWFFDQWVYSPNYPIYKWSWVYTSVGGKYYLDLIINQTQSTPAVFKMPLEFKLATASKDTFFTISDTLREQKYSLVLNSSPVSMTFDPNYKVLSADTTITYPALAGDLNKDGLVLLGDLIYLVNILFNGQPLPTPTALADVNGDCKISLADVVYLVNRFFNNGPYPKIGCP